MKTVIPTTIGTKAHAKLLLAELEKNGELINPEDDAHYIDWQTCEPLSPEECDKLNRAMQQIIDLDDDTDWLFDYLIPKLAE